MRASRGGHDDLLHLTEELVGILGAAANDDLVTIVLEQLAQVGRVWERLLHRRAAGALGAVGLSVGGALGERGDVLFDAVELLGQPVHLALHVAADCRGREGGGSGEGG